MTTEQDTAKAVTSAKSALTKAENALQAAIASGDMQKVMECSGGMQTATAELAKAEKLHEAATREQYVEQIDEARTAVKEVLSSAASSIEVLRRAGIKYVDIEMISEGNFTVSTRSGQRGVQPGSTRNVEKYEIDGVEYSAGELIKIVGPSKVKNHDTRLQQIADKTLKRKDYAREIVAALDGTVINPTE